MDNTLKNIIKDISFGIEFETCFHVMEKTYKDSDDALMGYFKIFNKNLSKIRSTYDEKGSQFHAFLSLDSSYRPEQYDNWIILPDDSVMCSSTGDKESDNECYKNGKVVGLVDCPDVDFFRLEIVTPKLKYKQKRILKIVWENAVMAQKTVYTSNDSQGLHINISHPKYKKVFKNVVFY